MTLLLKVQLLRNHDSEVIQEIDYKGQNAKQLNDWLKAMTGISKLKNEDLTKMFAEDKVKKLDKVYSVRFKNGLG